MYLIFKNSFLITLILLSLESRTFASVDISINKHYTVGDFTEALAAESDIKLNVTFSDEDSSSEDAEAAAAAASSAAFSPTERLDQCLERLTDETATRVVELSIDADGYSLGIKIKDTILAHIKGLKSLKKLSFKECDMSAVTEAADLPLLIYTLTSLKELTLSNCNLGCNFSTETLTATLDLHPLFETIGKNKSITDLDLSKNKDLFSLPLGFGKSAAQKVKEVAYHNARSAYFNKLCEDLFNPKTGSKKSIDLSKCNLGPVFLTALAGTSVGSDTELTLDDGFSLSEIFQFIHTQKNAEKLSVSFGKPSVKPTAADVFKAATEGLGYYSIDF